MISSLEFVQKVEELCSEMKGAGYDDEAIVEELEKIIDGYKQTEEA